MANATNGKVVSLGDHPRARSRLTPQESAGVLKDCRELALQRIVGSLSGMLDHVEDDLFEMAEKSRDRDAQNVYLDARAKARENRPVIEATFRSHFVEFFNRKVRGDVTETPPSAPGSELSLLADEDLEGSIAVSDMARKLSSQCEGELSALSQRRIAGAGLDVFDVEPLPTDHHLRKLDNAVLTPHLGYVSMQNYRAYYGGVVDDIRAFLDGKPVRVME
jgi:hypothetical protein